MNVLLAPEPPETRGRHDVRAPFDAFAAIRRLNATSWSLSACASGASRFTVLRAFLPMHEFAAHLSSMENISRTVIAEWRRWRPTGRAPSSAFACSAGGIERIPALDFWSASPSARFKTES